MAQLERNPLTVLGACATLVFLKAFRTDTGAMVGLVGAGWFPAPVAKERENTMTELMTASDIVRAYYESWTKGDMSRARSYLADDLDFQGPIDKFEGADQFIPALSGFASMLSRAELLQELYAGADQAALLYDCVTASPAGTIRTAEFFRLKSGKIAQIRLVFDATALRKLMGR